MQEAHQPQFVYLSKTAIAYLQTLCNIPAQQLGQKFNRAVKRS